MDARIHTALAVLVCCVLSCCTGGRTPDRTLTIALEVAPAHATVIAGRDLQLGALGIARDGTVQDLTRSADWQSTGDAVLDPNRPGLLTGVREGSCAVSIRYGTLEATLEVSILPAVLERIEVTPTGPTLALGTTSALTATGVFSDGSRIDATAHAAWSAPAAGIATVAGGLVTATGVGQTTVVALWNGVAGSTTLTVTAAVLVNLQIDPPNPSIPLGLDRSLTATGTFSDNSTQDLTATADWSSVDSGIATAGNGPGTKGLVTSMALGSTTVRATYGGIPATTTVQVSAATLQSIAVSPTTPSIALGTTQQFAASGTFSDNSVQDLTASATWISLDLGIASISNAGGSQGLATSIAQGATVIRATLGAVSGQTTLTVTAASLQSIAVTPSTPAIALGTNQAFTATGTYSDASQQDLTSAVTWSSTDPAVATVSNAGGSEGLATSVMQGTTTVGAALGAIQGTTTLTVTAATLVSLAVTPSTPSIALGTGQAFTATGTYTDASQQDLTTSVTWLSTAPGVATISNAGGSEGLATSVAQGVTTIRATSGAVSDQTTLTVTPATLQSIAITPGSAKVGVAGTLQMTATGTYSDASQQDLTTSATWASSSGAVATVSNAGGSEGEVTGVAAGSTTISATVGSVQGNTLVSVDALAFRAASSAGEGSNVTTLTVATPGAAVAGDTLVAFIAVRPESAVVTPPAGWTLIRGEVQPAGNGNALYAYRKTVVAGEAASHDWSFSSSGGSVGGILAISGANTATPIDAENGQSTPSGLVHTAPGVTTLAAQTVLLSAHAYSSSTAWNPPAGMTEVVDLASQPAGSAGLALECNWQAFSGPGATGDRAATADMHNDTGNCILVAIRP